jgi:hypothetical protein
MKLAYKIITMQYLMENNTASIPNIPKIYVKLKGWHPPPTSNFIEDNFTKFEKKFKEGINQYNIKRHVHSYLTPVQQDTLNKLKHSNNIVIIP